MPDTTLHYIYLSTIDFWRTLDCAYVNREAMEETATTTWGLYRFSAN